MDELNQYDFRAMIEMNSIGEGGVPSPFLPGGRIGIAFRFPTADTRLLAVCPCNALAESCVWLEARDALRHPAFGLLHAAIRAA